jgi:ubiquinone/menaquinone biosynthesis C-methylase UbiE
MPTAEAIEAGQAAYSPLVLRFYDLLVLGLSNHYLWRCPTAEIVNLHDRNVTARHLDIGVGTGYYLDHARWPDRNPSITLVDLDPNSLAAASHRLARFAPRSVRADCLEPLPLGEKFDSVSLCYLFHCLPGTLPEKTVVLDHLQRVLAPGARVFGATILQGEVPRSRPAQALMDFLQSQGRVLERERQVGRFRNRFTATFHRRADRNAGTVALFEARAAVGAG